MGCLVQPNEVIHKMADTDPALQDNQEGDDRPEWLPENFKTPEDLASSYKESQRKITEEATARRNLEQLVAQQQSALEQMQAAQQPVEDNSQDWYDAYEADPIVAQKTMAERVVRDEIAKLQQQNQQQQQETAASQVEVFSDIAFRTMENERGFPITRELQQEMGKLVTEHPYLVPEQAVKSPMALKSAFDVVLDLVAARNGPPAVQQEDLRRTMKLNAQTSEGAAGRPSSPDDFAQRWQEIQNAQTGKLGL